MNILEKGDRVKFHTDCTSKQSAVVTKVHNIQAHHPAIPSADIEYSIVDRKSFTNWIKKKIFRRGIMPLKLKRVPMSLLRRLTEIERMQFNS